MWRPVSGTGALAISSSLCGTRYASQIDRFPNLALAQPDNFNETEFFNDTSIVDFNSTYLNTSILIDTRCCNRKLAGIGVLVVLLYSICLLGAVTAGILGIIAYWEVAPSQLRMIAGIIQILAVLVTFIAAFSTVSCTLPRRCNTLHRRYARVVPRCGVNGQGGPAQHQVCTDHRLYRALRVRPTLCLHSRSTSPSFARSHMASGCGYSFWEVK